MTSPKVSVCIVTYNHEKYIRQCLDGVLMQETDFPIEVLIHDDASTDGTVEILQEYHSRHPELIHLILQEENHYSKGCDFVNHHLFSRVRGEFFAMCEGDDYWTNPNKLQTQVVFMESAPTVSICAHEVEQLYDGVTSGMGYVTSKQRGDYIFSFEHELKNHFVATASLVGRSYLIRSKPDNRSPLHLPLAMGDVFLILYLLSYGNGYMMKNKMAVKRKNPSSISRNRDYNRHVRINSFFVWCGILKFSPNNSKKYIRQRLARIGFKVLRKNRNYPKQILLQVALVSAWNFSLGKIIK